MRDESMPVFDQDEEVMANLLGNIGLKRNLAKALVYLANVNESCPAILNWVLACDNLKSV